MCGIGGVFYADRRVCPERALHRMADAMKERGPDDEGEYTEPGIGLVHRRLSIIDLTSAGRCPMTNENGSVQVVLNGEIYNYQALREELLGRGHRFRSQSDTEVLVHGYEEWGTDLVRRLDGMFAFAVWDQRNRQVFLARDRTGEKPLYYTETSGALVFASTLSALAAFIDNSLSVNTDAIECFLSHGFIPGPHTIWEGVWSFPPAHWGVREEGGTLQLHRYWDFPDREPAKMTVREAEDILEQALERSVKARMIADVPVGGFLSGGVDSSLVMAMAARHTTNIKTFSIGFQEEDFSELPYARQVARSIGAVHQELIVTEDNLLDIVPELIWQYGQPFADSSAIPTFLLSKFTRQEVKVSLSGDGGDESFAGYWRAEAGWYASLYRRALPHTLRRAVMPKIYHALGSMGLRRYSDRMTALNQLSLARPGAGYTNAESWLNYRDDLLGSGMNTAGHDPNVCRTGRSWCGTGGSGLQQLLYDDFQVLLPDDFLVKVDVASMAASVEVRPPMLDHHFLEAAWTLPDRMKLRLGQRKWILKRIAARYVPPEVIYRRKSGFALPMKHWWRGRLGTVLHNLMTQSRAASLGWIRPNVVHTALKQHVNGERNHDARLWQILWLELWARIMLDRSVCRQSSLREFL